MPVSVESNDRPCLTFLFLLHAQKYAAMPPHTRTKAAAPMPTYVQVLDRAPEEMQPWAIAEIDEPTF